MNNRTKSAELYFENKIPVLNSISIFIIMVSYIIHIVSNIYKNVYHIKPIKKEDTRTTNFNDNLIINRLLFRFGNFINNNNSITSKINIVSKDNNIMNFQFYLFNNFKIKTIKYLNYGNDKNNKKNYNKLFDIRYLFNIKNNIHNYSLLIFECNFVLYDIIFDYINKTYLIKIYYITIPIYYEINKNNTYKIKEFYNYLYLPQILDFINLILGDKNDIYTVTIKNLNDKYNNNVCNRSILFTNNKKNLYYVGVCLNSKAKDYIINY